MSKALSLIMVGFCAGLLFEGLAQEPLISNRANLNKALSIRLKARNIKFERPSGSALKIGNGSTVIFQNGTLSGVISSSKGSEPIKLMPTDPISEVPKKDIHPIEMRIFDRNIYLDRPVELFVVQDITGRSVMTVVNSHKITLGNLRSGVYVVRVQDKGATHTSKFILR